VLSDMVPAWECKLRPNRARWLVRFSRRQRESVCRERSISPDDRWEFPRRTWLPDPVAGLSAANQTADGHVRAPTVRRLGFDYPTVGAEVVGAKVDHIGRAGGGRSWIENRDCCCCE